MEIESKITFVRAVCIERCTHGSEGGVAQSRPDSTLLPYVNTCHLNDLSEIGYTPEAIMTDGRVNAFAAAWLLQQEIKRSGSLWHGVGHYHSRTPFRKYGYIRKIRRNMEQIRRDGLKSLSIHWKKKL